MIEATENRHRQRRVCFVLASMLLMAWLANASLLPAQEGLVPVEPGEIQRIMKEQPSTDPTATSSPSGIDLLSLMARGGAFMIPIGLMSLIVVALAVERMLTLRRRKILPRLLQEDLDDLCNPIDRFDPAAAYQSCMNQPSPAAHVVTSMLMRTGQPLADIERAGSETVQREVDRFGSPIRWLTLSAAATPLMGLLGTVWGMIVAFHESTTLTPDRSRSEQLSEGIYTALVTTLAGLVVAIPAAIMALYLENRLAKLFRSVEEVAFRVAPGLARFEGHQRMDASGKMHPMDGPVPPMPEVSGPKDVTKPPPRRSNKKRGGARAG